MSSPRPGTNALLGRIFKQKVSKRPIAQGSDSNQLESVLPKREQLIRSKKSTSAAVETVSPIYSVLCILACLSEKNFTALQILSLCRRGTGFFKGTVRTYQSPTY